jgi:protoporphyrin/coproporphyrin ferrochelatase
MLRDFPQALLDPSLKTGLILCGMGGPDGPESVEPFLRNLFRDPAIMPMPRFISQPLGWFIARRRSPSAIQRYLQVSPDGVSPQIETTGRQATLLADRLCATGLATTGTIAMRYWRPWPETAINHLLQKGAQQFLVVPTYPQYAAATTGSTLDFVIDKLSEIAPDKSVHVLPHWHLLPGYVQASADQATGLIEGLKAEGAAPEKTALLYVAHSLPESHIKKGDPYLDQTKASVAAIHRAVMATINQSVSGDYVNQTMTGSTAHLAFQSKVGPVSWIGPNITSEVTRLGALGCRHLVVQPVSFTCEHVETIVELDDELKALATQSGITDFRRGSALNTNSGWLDSLAGELGHRAFGNTKRELA